MHSFLYPLNQVSNPPTPRREHAASQRLHRHIGAAQGFAGPRTQRGISEVAALVAMLILLAVILGGLVVPGGLLIWESTHPNVVIASGPAGTFTSATSSPGGFFAPTLTSVQTSTGTVTVADTFSALRGSHLMIEERSKSDALRLCTTSKPQVCAPLAGAWGGALTPTAAAAYATLFARHGLSPDKVGQWLALGMMGSFMALVIVGVLGATSDDPDDNADDPAEEP